jgi:hypothetical protein
MSAERIGICKTDREVDDMNQVFSANLGTRERLLTYGVGYGVGFGVPVILGTAFAIGFSEPLLLLFPLPFILAFGAPYFFRPTGYELMPNEIAVLRPVGKKHIPLDALLSIKHPASRPPGLTIGLARVEGVHGTFGTFWNKSWGRYRAYVTNHLNTVELNLRNDLRIVISPDDPSAFIEAVREATALKGSAISIDSD